MTAATSAAQSAVGDARQRSTRRGIEAWLLACAAAGQPFELRPHLRLDVPIGGGGALLCVVCEMASRSDLLLGK